MTPDEFVQRFGGVFEHSPWIAERAWKSGLPARLDAASLHSSLCAVFRAATQDEQTGVIRAHPDLAGKLAVAAELTAASRAEQASAGLDQCTTEEFDRFQILNDAYKSKFGFPFILAVRGLSRGDILSAFEKRIKNDTAGEFEEALRQIEKIALLRLNELLP